MTPDPAPERPRRPAGVVPAVGVAAGRPLFLRNDRRVRAARQHLRSLPDRRETVDLAPPTTLRTPRSRRRRRYGVLAEFLAEQLFGRWSLVLHYDLGRGLRAFAGRDEKRLKEMVDAGQQEARRPERAAEGSGRDVRDSRPVRPQQHHGRRGRPAEPRGDHRPGLVRVSHRRARPPQHAGLVAARDDAELGDEPARQAHEHGVRA